MPSNPHRRKARRSQGGSGSSEGSSQQPLPSRWALREGPASAGAPGQPWGACRAALGLCALGFPSGCATRHPCQPATSKKVACESFMGLCLKIDEVRPMGPIPGALQGALLGPQTPQGEGRGLADRPGHTQGARDREPVPRANGKAPSGCAVRSSRVTRLGEGLSQATPCDPSSPRGTEDHERVMGGRAEEGSWSCTGPAPA